MNVEIRDPGTPISEADIQAFEQRHHLTLPSDYRAFMLQYNGGYPWLVCLAAEDHRTYNLRQLYSIRSGNPFDLDNQCKCLDWPASYKNGIIVIGNDIGGSEFLMATTGHDAGTIYFLNREVTLRPKGRMNRVAGSFKEMMDKLQPLFPEGLNFQS